MLPFKPHRILIVGTGSGRDIVASVLIQELFLDKSVEVDIAGFLTPWAIHFFDEHIEPPIINLNETKSTKFKKVIISENKEVKGFFEPLLVDIFKKFEVRVNNIYLLSLHYGFVKLFNELVYLVDKNRYDAVLAVDVGGDILATSEDYQSVLTPLVDWNCLTLLCKLSKELALYLAVVSPGVCGEITLYRLYKIIEQIKNLGFFVKRVKFNKTHKSYQKFNSVNKEINALTGAYSHTFYIINKVVESCLKSKFLKMTYKKKYQIKDMSFEALFERVLDVDLIQSVYFFNIRELNRIRPHFKEHYYSNLILAFKKLRQLGVCGTEIDLCAVPENLNTKKLTYLLTPCCYVSEKLREEMIYRGVELSVINKKIHKMLLLRSDLDRISFKKVKSFFEFYPCNKHVIMLLKK